MENIVLGKTLKAMQKLSGQSVGELAEKAELTIDTVNNLFYARVQKPSFDGVCRLVECMGYSVGDLMALLHEPRIAEMDVQGVMEMIEAYTNADETADRRDENALREQAVQNAKEHVFRQEVNTMIGYDTLEQHNERQNELYEKQLDRFRNTHLTYVAQLKEQYEAQLAQAQAFSNTTIHGLEKLVEEQRERVRVTAERYERELDTIRTEYEKTQAGHRLLTAQWKRIVSWLIVLLLMETLTVFAVLVWKIAG